MIERQAKCINILCKDSVVIRGFVNVIGEQKALDIINNPQEKFILLSDAEIIRNEELQSFKLATKRVEEKSNVILNKEVIKWIVESEKEEENVPISSGAGGRDWFRGS